MPLPVGLVYDAAGHVILDPDTAVRGAVAAPVRHLRGHRVGHRLREGVQHRRAVVPLAAPERPPQGRDRLEAAGPPRGAAGAAQPPLRRRVHLWSPRPPQAARREAEHRTAAPRGMDLLHPRRSPRIHHPGPARRQPRPPSGQRRRPRTRPAARAAPRRPRAAAGHHHLRPLRAAHDRPVPPARPRPATRGPHLHLPARRHRERTTRSALRSPAKTWTRPSGSCSSTPSPRSPSKPPCRCPPSSSTGPPKRTRCAPPTSNAPATTPTWPAAATWPSTPPTGSSPTPSKPTGTPPSAPSTRPRTPTRRPARSTPGSSPTPRRPESSSWSPTCPPSGTTPPPRQGNASASPGCCSPTSP